MGAQRMVQEGLEQAMSVLRWLSSSLQSDNDIEASVDNSAGEEAPEAEAAEVWTVAGLQSRPKDGSESAGYAHALSVQLGDTTLIIGTHDPRHVEVCEVGEVVLHALGKDGALRALVRLKPDGSIDVSGTNVVIGNPDGTLNKIALGEAIKSHFDTIASDFASHVHPAGTLLDSTAGACTGATAVTATALTAAPTSLYSAKHSVET